MKCPEFLIEPTRLHYAETFALVIYKDPIFGYQTPDGVVIGYKHTTHDRACQVFVPNFPNMAAAFVLPSPNNHSIEKGEDGAVSVQLQVGAVDFATREMSSTITVTIENEHRFGIFRMSSRTRGRAAIDSGDGNTHACDLEMLPLENVRAIAEEIRQIDRQGMVFASYAKEVVTGAPGRPIVSEWHGVKAPLALESEDGDRYVLTSSVFMSPNETDNFWVRPAGSSRYVPTPTSAKYHYLDGFDGVYFIGTRPHLLAITLPKYNEDPAHCTMAPHCAPIGSATTLLKRYEIAAQDISALRSQGFGEMLSERYEIIAPSLPGLKAKMPAQYYAPKP